MVKWKDVLWSDITEELIKMTEQIENFSRDCSKLPGQLKQWPAYKEMKQEIDDLIDILPLVEGLAKPSIRPRHWDEIIEMTKENIPYDDDLFSFDQLMQAPLLQFKDDLEDISERADKELKLENQLNNDVIAYWEDAELQIKMWKGIDQPCLLGGNIQDLQEKLEEHIILLNQFNAVRHVKPFKPLVVEKITLISDVSDTIERWLKVQTLWTNLVSVFTGGDIAKQMPTESKMFKKINT
jgi:dynein heavy chain